MGKLRNCSHSNSNSYNPGHKLFHPPFHNINVDGCIRGQITWQNIDNGGSGHRWGKHVLKLYFEVINCCFAPFLSRIVVLA
jgi:hypothetical protein